MFDPLKLYPKRKKEIPPEKKAKRGGIALIILIVMVIIAIIPTKSKKGAPVSTQSEQPASLMDEKLDSLLLVLEQEHGTGKLTVVQKWDVESISGIHSTEMQSEAITTIEEKLASLDDEWKDLLGVEELKKIKREYLGERDRLQNEIDSLNANPNEAFYVRRVYVNSPDSTEYTFFQKLTEGGNCTVEGFQKTQLK